MKNNYYIPFTKEMKKDYTILVPDMLPMHFKLIGRVLENFGFHIELLTQKGKQIAQTGLKYVHNDTCYPALLVIGQFIDALQSGKYDVNKTALIMFQTGGGCRASNYISLIRKALAKAGFGHVPVISMSFAGIEKHPGFKITLPMVRRMMYAILYADLLMLLVNQAKPYEIEDGATERLANEWITRLSDEMRPGERISYDKVKADYKEILDSFTALPKTNEKKVRVGVVGEIYVKYSPLANNCLNDFLIREGAEVIVPGLLDFCLFITAHHTEDYPRYGGSYLKYRAFKLAKGYFEKKQRDMLDAVKENGHFHALSAFSHTEKLVDGYIDRGCKMGEGWLLTAEMLELAENGVPNIVCAQPFGCLPNHICGKGMMKPIKEKNPDVNIVAIDYDPGMSVVNQENRIKLMLANARMRLEAEEAEKEKTEEKTEKKVLTTV